MQEFDDRLNASWWVLRIGLGVGPIIAGIDKYFNRLTDWTMYLSPLATKVIPVSPSTFMHVIGAVEIVAGLLVLSRWTQLAAMWGAMAGGHCRELVVRRHVLRPRDARPGDCGGGFRLVTADRGTGRGGSPRTSGAKNVGISTGSFSIT